MEDLSVDIVLHHMKLYKISKETIDYFKGFYRSKTGFICILNFFLLFKLTTWME